MKRIKLDSDTHGSKSGRRETGKLALLFALPCLTLLFPMASNLAKTAYQQRFPEGYYSYQASPPVVSPDGTMTAQVIGTHEPGDFDVEEWFYWYFRLKEGNGAWDYIRFNYYDSAKPNASGNIEDKVGEFNPWEVTYTLQWSPDGKQLSFQNSRGEKGVRENIGGSFYPAKELRVSSPAMLQRKLLPLTSSLRKRLTKWGRSKEEIDSLRYVRLQGDNTGAYGKRYVNLNQKVLLVVGPGFVSHQDIISRGPVICFGPVNFMSDFATSQWVILDGSSSIYGRISAAEIFAAPGVNFRRDDLIREPQILF